MCVDHKEVLEQIKSAEPSTEGAAPSSLKEFLRSIERGVITEALRQRKGVKAEAARLMRMNRATLVERMKSLGLDLAKEAYRQ